MLLPLPEASAPLLLTNQGQKERTNQGQKLKQVEKKSKSKAKNLLLPVFLPAGCIKQAHPLPKMGATKKCNSLWVSTGKGYLKDREGEAREQKSQGCCASIKQAKKNKQLENLRFLLNLFASA